ncbi:uncharacterized protein CDAR_558631 [Caerostris darwini]|uniref:Uncharacterized protein n=1 Tax=Caerostris darwini TaxID=1538125 RepID=A0AAV4UZA8_9ARAC|nr:uncharacterized protein CDAR_558631 [Caerostris darwini]
MYSAPLVISPIPQVTLKFSLQNQGPCPLVTVENAEPPETNSTNSIPAEEECATPPARVRMRSLSGGTYRLSTTLPATGRMRRQSGDDVLTRVSPSEEPPSSSTSGPGPSRTARARGPPSSATSRTPSSAAAPRGRPPWRSTPLTWSPCSPVEITDRGPDPESGSKKPLASLVPTNALLRRHSVDPDRRRRPYNTYRSLEAHQGDTYVGHNEDDGVGPNFLSFLLLPQCLFNISLCILRRL